MHTLYVLNEIVSGGFSYIFINIISLASILSGILVIISKNPIVSVLFLIGLFFSIAGYLMMLGINFIGLSYLLVYVGAVSILFLFILMLINIRVSELISDSSNSIPLAIVIGILFNITLYGFLPSNQQLTTSTSVLKQSMKDIGEGDRLLMVGENNDISFVTSQLWDGALAETSHITTLGNVIYTSYPMWLIITSIILLLAMVGSIVITIKHK